MTQQQNIVSASPILDYDSNRVHSVRICENQKPVLWNQDRKDFLQDLQRACEGKVFRAGDLNFRVRQGQHMLLLEAEDLTCWVDVGRHVLAEELTAHL
jgi:hypothetical protein